MASMKAVTFLDFGGPAVLQATVVDRPEPGPDDVLVCIHAAGVCYHDVLSRGGKILGGQPGRILGHEMAGEIAAVGSNVAPDRIGERVVWRLARLAEQFQQRRERQPGRRGPVALLQEQAAENLGVDSGGVQLCIWWDAI